jgi:MscS family membrane protein
MRPVILIAVIILAAWAGSLIPCVAAETAVFPMMAPEVSAVPESPAASPVATDTAPALTPSIASAATDTTSNSAETAAPKKAESPWSRKNVLAWFQAHLPRWALNELLGIAVWQFIVAFVFLLGALVLKKVSDYIFGKNLIPLLRRTLDHTLADAASKPLGYLILLGGLAGAMWVLRLPQEPFDLRGTVDVVLKVFLTADIMWFLFRLVDVLAVHLSKLTGRAQSKLDDHLVPLIRKCLKVTVGVVLALWLVQLLGYNVSSLLAGLGIGGLAVALALQDTLSNFFGSVVILLDRPFQVGHMVKIDGFEGRVEEIGFRSPRLRTWPATLVSIPNKTVATATIDNLSRMPKRGVIQTIGLASQTRADQVVKARDAIRQIIVTDPGVDPEFILVAFEDFGASSLDLKLIYYTKAVVFADHLVTKERVNLAIMRTLEGLDISMSSPTRVVHFEGEIAKEMAARRKGDAPER